MRSRFPAIVLGLALLAGSLASVLTASVATAPHARSGAWAFTGIDVSKWQETIDWPTVATPGRLRDHQGDREPVDDRSGVRDEPCERRGGRGAHRHVPRRLTERLARRRARRGQPFPAGRGAGRGQPDPGAGHRDQSRARLDDPDAARGVGARVAEPCDRQARRAPDGLRQRVHVRDAARQHDVVRRSRVSALARPVGAAPLPVAGQRLAGPGLDVLAVVEHGHRPRHHDRCGSRPLRRHEALPGDDRKPDRAARRRRLDRRRLGPPRLRRRAPAAPSCSARPTRSS